MRFRTLVALLALLFALPALAEDRRPVPPPPVPTAVVPPAAPATKRLVTKVFTVAELVGPSPALDGEKAIAAYRANTEKLVKLVTDMVRPYSWDAAGGAGKAEYFDLGTALVVTNTADVIAEVADLLAALQKIGAVTLTYEVRLLRAPVGTFERAGVRADRDIALTIEQLRAVLEAGQADRDASVTQFPRATASNGEPVTARCGDTRTFVTGLDVTKVKGLTVFVPRQTAVHLGESVTLKGVQSADQQYVRVEAAVTHARLVGTVELIPVTTKITPVFEGGSQGQPIPFTQFIQVPDVRKDGAERTAVVPNGGTLVIGSWKQPAEPRGKGKPGQELEVLALATVRTTFDMDGAQNKLVAPATARLSQTHKLRNAAAADAARALTEQFKGSGAAFVAEPVANTIFVSGDRKIVEQAGRLVAQLDKAPPQVVVQAMLVEVPDGFLDKCGLKAEAGTGAAANTCVLTPREMQMFNALLRAAKEKGECDVLSRPQMQVADNQTGLVQVGQQYPVNGADGKVDYKQLGVTLRVTPRIAPDGKTVLLSAETQHAWVDQTLGEVKTTTLPGTVFPLTTFTVRPRFYEHQVRTATSVPFGHTVVSSVTEQRVRTSSTAAGERAQETVRVQKLVILTPFLVTPSTEVKPALAAPLAEVKPAAGWFTK